MLHIGIVIPPTACIVICSTDIITAVALSEFSKFPYALGGATTKIGITFPLIRNLPLAQFLIILVSSVPTFPDFAIRGVFDFFGYSMKYPIFAGPVGAVNLHYGDLMDDVAYNDILVSGCAEAGILAFTGDGTNPAVMQAASKAIANVGGKAVPTVKPWDVNTLEEKFALVRASGCFAVAMDVDAAGLPFLQNLNPPAGSKTVEELREIIKASGKPFIVKGVMTVKGAKKALEAGASAIIVSNHGGRVLDQCPATAEVLPEIADAVGDRMMVLVDGGIRDGVDVFKALALGADGVVCARPYVTAVYGGRQEGVKAYTEKLGKELADAMKMCGTPDLASITRACVR